MINRNTVIDRNFEVGNMVISKESGVFGRVLTFYYPISPYILMKDSYEEHTSVKLDDGTIYYAPTRTWVKEGTYEYTDAVVKNNG